MGDVTRYFEDYQVGDRFETPGITLTRSEIIDFALRYDPQSIHMDQGAAAAGPYGRLIASGFQTLVLSFRLFFQRGWFEGSGLGSPGIDEMRWLKPVYAGDTIRAVIQVEEARPSTSQPERGVLVFRYDTYNQNDEKVMTFRAPSFVRRRPNSDGRSG
ncbi:MAG: MaoC family dehydratase [Kiloniellales bacterium]